MPALFARAHGAEKHCHSGGAIPDPELSEDRREVELHPVNAHRELPCDLLVRQSLSGEREDGTLSCRETRLDRIVVANARLLKHASMVGVRWCIAHTPIGQSDSALPSHVAR